MVYAISFFLQASHFSLKLFHFFAFSPKSHHFPFFSFVHELEASTPSSSIQTLNTISRLIFVLGFGFFRFYCLIRFKLGFDSTQFHLQFGLDCKLSPSLKPSAYRLLIGDKRKKFEEEKGIIVRFVIVKIFRHNNLNSYHDFDLVFSDAVTGGAYVDENFQIPSGSSVIIKRVPAGLVHSAIGACNGTLENLKLKNTKVVDTNEPREIDDFGDFGAEWCPVTVPEVTSFDYKPHPEKKYCTSGDDTSTDTILRPGNLAEPLLRCQLLLANPVVESHHGAEEHLNADKRVVVTDHPSTHTPDLPSELRCSICNTYFNEAVTIPCCQHSFCKRCDKRKKFEEEKGIIVHFVIGHSATSGGILDRAIEAGDSKHGDLLRLDHVEGYLELLAKTKTYFATAVALWNADFFVKVDDDVHVNIATLGTTSGIYRMHEIKPCAISQGRKIP